MTEQPTGPVRGSPPGVAAIEWNRNKYCLGCAPYILNRRNMCYQTSDGDWKETESSDGENIVEGITSGDIQALEPGEIVLKNSVEDSETEHYHCSMGNQCWNSVFGDISYEHLDCDSLVGVLLEV